MQNLRKHTNGSRNDDIHQLKVHLQNTIYVLGKYTPQMISRCNTGEELILVKKIESLETVSWKISQSDWCCHKLQAFLRPKLFIIRVRIQLCSNIYLQQYPEVPGKIWSSTSLEAWTVAVGNCGVFHCSVVHWVFSLHWFVLTCCTALVWELLDSHEKLHALKHTSPSRSGAKCLAFVERKESLVCNMQGFSHSFQAL